MPPLHHNFKSLFCLAICFCAHAPSQTVAARSTLIYAWDFTGTRPNISDSRALRAGNASHNSPLIGNCEGACVPAPAPVGSSLCSASGMSADPAWGDKIIQCASTATECEGNFMKRSANSFPSPQLTHLLPRSALAIHAFLSSASL